MCSNPYKYQVSRDKDIAREISLVSALNPTERKHSTTQFSTVHNYCFLLVQLGIF